MADYNPWLSASQVIMFLKCARQWAFRYIEHKIRPPKGVMKQSTALHKVAETNYNQKIESHLDLPMGQMTEQYAQYFEDEWNREEVLLDPDQTKGKLKDQGIEGTRVYHNAIAPKVMPALVEQPFDVTLGKEDYGFVLKGRIDVVDVSGAIRDNKFTGMRMNQNDVDKDLQLSTYSLARRMQLKHDAGDLSALSEEERTIRIKAMVEPKLTLDVVFKQRSGNVEPKFLETQRSREALSIHLNTIGNIAKSIRADAFPRNPNGWWCSPKWCGYWDLCMGKAMTFVDLGENLEAQLQASVDAVEKLDHREHTPTEAEILRERDPGEEG